MMQVQCREAVAGHSPDTHAPSGRHSPSLAGFLWSPQRQAGRAAIGHHALGGPSAYALSPQSALERHPVPNTCSQPRSPPPTSSNSKTNSTPRAPDAPVRDALPAPTLQPSAGSLVYHPPTRRRLHKHTALRPLHPSIPFPAATSPLAPVHRSFSLAPPSSPRNACGSRLRSRGLQPVRTPAAHSPASHRGRHRTDPAQLDAILATIES